MAPSDPSAGKQNKSPIIQVLKVLFVLAVIAVLTRFLMVTDFSALWEQLKEAPHLLPVLMGISFLGYLCGTIAWQLCLGNEVGKVSTAEMFVFRLVSDNLSIFNPTTIVAGDGLKAILLNKKQVERQNGITSVLLSRVLLIISAVLLMVVSLIYLLVKAEMGQQQTLVIVGFSAGALVLMYFFTRLFLHKNLYLARFIGRLQRTVLSRWLTQDHVDRITEVNQDLVDYYKNFSLKMVGAFLFSVVHWIFGALEFYFILKFFGLPIDVIDAIAVETGVIAFKSLGSVIPGQLGVEEYGNKVMLSAIGVVSNEIWIVVSLLRRGRQVLWLLIAGIASIFLYRKYKIKGA